MARFKHLNLFLKEVFLFGITQVLGIIAVWRLSYVIKDLKIEPKPISIPWFLVYFIVATLIILLFIRVSKGRGSGIFLRLFFIFAIFSGLQVIFSLFIPDFQATILALFLVIMRFVRPTVWLHNLVVIGGIAGIGSMLGFSITPRDAIILLIILSVYDVIAVYKTKHMVKMVKEMIRQRVVFALIIPEKVRGLKASLKEVEREKLPTIHRRRKAKPTPRSPVGRFLILGGGDLALPLLLIASVAHQSILKAVVILVFALLGLFSMHFIFLKLKGRPMPALPPLALFSIIGYLITLLI